MTDAENIESLVTRASGSVGVTTFSHNQHGPYTCPRTVPADPGSALQVAVRAALSQCVTAWNATLTQPERDTWELYALAVRPSSPIGRRTNVGGLGMYVRSNVPRLQAAEVSLPRVDVAPSINDLASPSPLQRVVLDVVSDTLHVFFDTADVWNNQAGSALLFYASTGQPLTRNFWKGPYRYAGPILGRPFPPAPSPSTLPLPFAYDPGHRCFIRYRLTSHDGRLSSSRRLTADHLPQVPPVPIAVTAQFIFPTLLLHVYFDHLLTPAFLATAPWAVQNANFLWNVGSAIALDNRIRILCTRGPANVAPNAVTYTPPPADVIALLTSIPAAGFTRPIPWP